jgi:hypothetical protein
VGPVQEPDLLVGRTPWIVGAPAVTLRNLILDSFGWKLASVALALLVWWRVNKIVDREQAQSRLPAAYAEQTRSLTVTVPVRVLAAARLPRGFAVVPGEVTVTLHGKVVALEPVNATNLVAYVDAALPPAVKAARLPVVVRPPAGVVVQAINPPEVFVERM